MNSSFEIGNNFRVRTNVKLSDTPFLHGEIALWTSESLDGIGLHALGILIGIEVQDFQNDRSEGNHEEYTLTVLIIRTVVQVITRSNLARVRGVRDVSPLSKLDEHGYFQSHRKIKNVDPDVACFLRSRFV